MRYITAALRWFLFIVFFLFALKNHEAATLKFYFELEWKVPLVLLLFVFFITGAVAGLLALLPRVFRQRRELLALQAEVKKAGKQLEARADAPRDAVAPGA